MIVHEIDYQLASSRITALAASGRIDKTFGLPGTSCGFASGFAFHGTRVVGQGRHGISRRI